MSDTNLTVERKDGTGHYVISAMVVDHDDYEFRYAVQFWGYEHDEVDQMKEDFLSYVNDNGYVLS
jgi:hypothetical protein